MKTEIDIGMYHFTGGSVMNRPDLEGVALHFRSKQKNPETSLDVIIEKHDAAHIAQLIQDGRKYWKRFRLPKMYEQQRRQCPKCHRETYQNKIGGKWRCMEH